MGRSLPAGASELPHIGYRTLRHERSFREARFLPDTRGVLEALVDVIASLYARLVGRPWQERRAGQLIKQGKVRCVLFDADEGVLPGRSLSGVAEVSEKRLRLNGVELWVRAIEGSPDDGPIDPFAHDGTFRPSDGNLTFEPRTRIYRLKLHNAATVRWSVLAFQAEQALDLLGFQDASKTSESK